MDAKAKIYAILSNFILKWVKKLATAATTCFKWISGGTIGKMGIAVFLGVLLSGSVVYLFHHYCPQTMCEHMLCELVWRHSPWLLFTGLATAPSMLLTWFWRRQQNVERLITERFAKATEQLGSDQMAVRLGAIYQLERIAQDSKRDHWTVVETLSAYIRENARWEEEKTEEPDQETPKQEAEITPPATDIQAALTVLGRRTWRDTEKNRIDLSNTNLQRADLSYAHLEGASFKQSHLEQANLYCAQLEQATLNSAHLEKVNLRDANIKKAKLVSTHLEGAILMDANLKGAILIYSNLKRAELVSANLEGAILESINLEQATLVAANLKGAILNSANLEESDLIDAQLEDAALRSAKLKKANLMYVNLKRTNLRNTNFEGTHLMGANLSGAKINIKTSFSNAKYSKETIFPDGFTPKEYGMKLMIFVGSFKQSIPSYQEQSFPPPDPTEPPESS